SRTEGGAQVVGIVGEAGIGKSRLLYEFRQGLEGHDIEWLEASCASYTADVPYSAIVPLMRQACGILDTDDSVAVDGKVRRHLTQRAMNQPEEDGPYLGRLIAGEGDTVNGVDTDQRRIRSRTFEAVRRVLLNT